MIFSFSLFCLLKNLRFFLNFDLNILKFLSKFLFMCFMSLFALLESFQSLTQSVLICFFVVAHLFSIDFCLYTNVFNVNQIYFICLLSTDRKNTHEGCGKAFLSSKVRQV